MHRKYSSSHDYGVMEILPVTLSSGEYCAVRSKTPGTRSDLYDMDDGYASSAEPKRTGTRPHLQYASKRERREAQRRNRMLCNSPRYFLRECCESIAARAPARDVLI